MGIIAIVGDPGAGKSAFGYRIAGIHARHDRRQVLSTYDMDWYNVHTRNWAEMCHTQNTVCIVDEGSDLFNTRDWNKEENKAQIQLFREHRKDAMTLYLIAQSFEHLDKHIRDLTWQIWHVKRMFGPDMFEGMTPLEQKLGVWCYARKFFAKQFGTAKARMTEKMVYNMRPSWGRFDTLAKSAGKSSLQQVRGSGLAPGRRPKDEVAALGENRPSRVMPISRAVYLASSQPHLDDFGNGITRWRSPGEQVLADGQVAPEPVEPVRPRAAPARTPHPVARPVPRSLRRPGAMPVFRLRPVEALAAPPDGGR